MLVYHYTAVGDSLTFGFGAMPGSGFVPLYRRMAEERLQQFVAHENMGINGLTSEGLYERIVQNPAYRYHLQQAHIITITIGCNDLIRAVNSAGGRPYRESLDRALLRCQYYMSNTVKHIRNIKAGGGKAYFIRAVGLYNPYPASGEAGEYVSRFNRYLHSLSDVYFRIADVNAAFAGKEKELLSVDGLHPNGKGYRIVAEQLHRLGYKPLV